MSRKSDMKWWQIYKASKVYSVLAFILLVLGSLIIRAEIIQQAYFQPAVGKVIENYHSYLAKTVMRNARVRYKNTIEYSVNGLSYRFTSNTTPFGVSPTVLPVGKSVDIRFNPDSPDKAVLKNSATDAVVYGIGAVLIITSLCLFLALCRRYKYMLEENNK